MQARHAAEIAKKAAMAADRQASAAAAAAAKVAAEQLRKQEQFLLRANMDVSTQLLHLTQCQHVGLTAVVYNIVLHVIYFSCCHIHAVMFRILVVTDILAP